MNIRIGQGYDVHRLVEGRPLILGGVTIPHSKGLLGHSDADALLHAITDALLGAAALGDIGKLFPDTAAEHKDADSRYLLREAYQAVQRAGWRVVNVDSTVIAQQPKLRPHIDAMRANIAPNGLCAAITATTGRTWKSAVACNCIIPPKCRILPTNSLPRSTTRRSLISTTRPPKATC